MKIYIANGNLFFKNENILMACPLIKEGIINLDEDSCEVENNEYPKLIEKIKQDLSD